MIGDDKARLDHSIRARLLNHARRVGEEYNLTLRRYFFERFLFRLGRSDLRERYVLKGAMLLGVWSDRPYRATMDLDLLRRGPTDPETLAADLRSVCATPVPEDAVDFDASSLVLDEIHKGEEYAGQRVHLKATLGSARDRLQIDVGTGDSVWPDPEAIDFPSLLDLPKPRILAYHRETVVAEKLEAMVALGLSNSRIKDIFDVHHLATSFAFEGATLARAISQTFRRRSTPLPSWPLVTLSQEYWEPPERATQLKAFSRRARIAADLSTARTLLPVIGAFLEAPLAALRRHEPFAARWRPGGPWESGASAEH